MKVLAISSGKKDGRHDSLAKAALMGAKDMGAEVEFINLFDLELKPCTGCNACVVSLMNGGRGDCVMKDDYNWLEDKIFDADALVFANPVFEKGVPSIMRIVQDRLCGPANDYGMNLVAQKIAEGKGSEGPDKRKFKPKVVSFIASGGSDWTSRVSCDMNCAAMSGMWKVIDDVVYQWNALLMMEEEKFNECYQIGANLVKAAANPAEAKYLGTPGICPNCNSRNFLFTTEGKVLCEVCGVQGDMVCDNGAYTFIVPESEFELAHTTIPGKIKHMDDINANTGKAMAAMQTPEYKAVVQKYKDFISGSKPQKA